MVRPAVQLERIGKTYREGDSERVVLREVSIAIAPGEIDTAILSPGTEKIVEEQIPMRRLGTPDEVADVILFLCEKGASYVSGAEIQINGGQHV